ncbi:thioredoxin reductase glit [Lojkania enalia]|uniref:Thioredoxin reductase glit n=1 Tax=Lojkania enalia TaxID=147567 RepID=A0A9P4JZ86_9PLEO|nr:thioredoxin reductase glit [Didymosphaeria enalia]
MSSQNTQRLATFSALALLLAYTLPGVLPYNFQSVLVDKSEEYDGDVLIIGGGHAGLSGASTLVRHQHNVIVFDDGKPRNKWDTPIHVVPTFDGQKPSDLRKASRRELQKSGLVKFVDERVVKLEKQHDSLFHATTLNGTRWTGRKVLLAPGVEFSFPDISGYKEHFPEKILHCLFTRAFEFKGSASAAVIAADLASSPPHAVILAEDAGKFAEKVTLYTNGDTKLKDQVQAILAEKGENQVPVDSRKITEIAKGPDLNSVTLKFEDGGEKTQNFIVHQPFTKVNTTITDQLGVEVNPRGNIITSLPFYTTHSSGVFAAGDSASPFNMIANAIFQGSNAGAGIARQLPRRVTGNRVDRVKEGGISQWISTLWKER